MIVVPTDPGLHRVFDAIAWAAGLGAGGLVYKWRLKGAAAAYARAPGYFIALGAGAILGAYLAGSFPAIMSGDVALSHSVAGALAGAIIAVEFYKAAKGVRVSTGAAFVVPFSVGIVVGRWGCLFAGVRDGTYGTPTNLPWAVDLGDGIARHPVQIYESLAMAAFLFLYLNALRRRASWALAHGFHVMAIWYGVQRFAWEFLKPYPLVLGPLNLFHLISLGLVAYGCVWIARSRTDQHT